MLGLAYCGPERHPTASFPEADASILTLQVPTASLHGLQRSHITLTPTLGFSCLPWDYCTNMSLFNMKLLIWILEN